MFPSYLSGFLQEMFAGVLLVGDAILLIRISRSVQRVIRLLCEQDNPHARDQKDRNEQNHRALHKQLQNPKDLSSPHSTSGLQSQVILVLSHLQVDQPTREIFFDKEV